MINREKQKLLLHVCCGPCACFPLFELKKNFDVSLLFYGPNIHLEEEYKKRLDSAFRLAGYERLVLTELEYSPGSWFNEVKGLEGEPENGERCKVCYETRLRRTAKFAKENGYKIFGTTLTASPHKPAHIINSIGEKIAGSYGLDFLKTDVVRKSRNLSKEYGLYRQNYCGCIFSKR